MRWWGWGEDGHAVALPLSAETLLQEELEVDPAARRLPVAFEQVSVPDSRLPAAARERLVAVVGAENVRDEREARIGHAAGAPIPTWCGSAPATRRARPDAVVAARLAPSRWRRCSPRARSAG